MTTPAAMTATATTSPATMTKRPGGIPVVGIAGALFCVVLIYLALQIRALQRVLHHQQHAVAGERLFQEVEGTAPRRVNGIADGPVP